MQPGYEPFSDEIQCGLKEDELLAGKQPVSAEKKPKGRTAKPASAFGRMIQNFSGIPICPLAIIR